MVKRRFLRVGVLIFGISGLALPVQAASFSNASLKGSYSFLINKWTTDLNSPEVAMVGVITFNGAGNVAAGSATAVSGGVALTGLVGGRYTVNADGTGEILVTNSPVLGPVLLSITLNSTAAGVAHGFQILETDDTANEVISGTGLLLSTASTSYNAASLSGNFAFQANLWSADSSIDEEGDIGVLSFDGKGHLKGSYTNVDEGVVSPFTLTGTYTVNADGTCRTSLVISDGATPTLACALNSAGAGGAKGIQLLLTNPGPRGGDNTANYEVTVTAVKQGVGFSDASLKGSYSFLVDRWTTYVPHHELAEVGVLTFDGAGNVTGSGTLVENGVSLAGGVAGTYTVNPNGTGTIDFNTLPGGGTAQVAFVLNSAAAGLAQGFQLMQTDDPKNEVTSGTGLLQSTTPAAYSAASLGGNFAFQANLWSSDPSIDAQGDVGIFTFDGKGHTNVSYTEVQGGVASTYTWTGTYAVNSDGTCSVSLVVSNGTTPTFACALNSVGAGGAKGIQLLLTNPGPRGGDNTTNYELVVTAVKQGIA